MSSSFGHYPYVGDDPAGVESAMTDLGRVANALSGLAGEVEQDTAAIRDHWPKGHTGQVAAADAARIGGALEECHQVFARAGRDLGDLEQVLVWGRRKVDDLNDAHRVLSEPENILQSLAGGAFGQRGVAADIFAAAKARSGYCTVADIDTAYVRVKARVVEETGLCNQLLSRLTAQGCSPVGQATFAGGVSKYDASFGLLAAWSGRAVADILAGRTPFPSDPKGVNAAWLALQPDQRAELLALEPGRFGNLIGVPAADRNIANRATLTKQLDRVADAVEAMGMEPTTDPNGLDGLSQGQIRVMATFGGLKPNEARQALLLRAQLDVEDIPTTLLAYEPQAYGGQGRAAIAFGDVDKAANVGFAVPGLNSGLHNIQDVAGDALALFLKADRADPSRETAVVAWQGYEAPGFLAVPFQGKAEAGAKLLAADVNAIGVTHVGLVPNLTVVGHSYGSTTTSLALQREGMVVNQAVLIGSPGGGGQAKSVADLGMDKSTVFVGSASTDAVTRVPDSLGEDPTEAVFGATRIKAEPLERGTGPNLQDHSLYYKAGSESLYALAAIVTGQGERLGPEGMLAEPRYVEKVTSTRGIMVDTLVEPESGRAPTGGHEYASPGKPSP